jgi:hypothetical protein
LIVICDLRGKKSTERKEMKVKCFKMVLYFRDDTIILIPYEPKEEHLHPSKSHNASKRHRVSLSQAAFRKQREMFIKSVSPGIRLTGILSLHPSSESLGSQCNPKNFLTRIN